MRINLLILLSLITLVGVVSADTSIVYTSNTTDGYIYRVSHNITFSDTFLGVATGSNTAITPIGPRLLSDLQINTYYRVQKGVLIFPSPNIPPSATIDSAAISLYRNANQYAGGDPGIGITKYTSSTITVGDYQSFKNDYFSSNTSIQSLSVSQYYNWNLNSLGKSNVSKQGVSGFGVRLGLWDIENVAPTSWSANKETYFYYLQADNVVNTPYLTIEWTPDTTPPNSITNLQNISTNCNQLLFTWTNPTDTDFAHTLIYKDNVVQANAGNTTTTLTWAGLNPSQAYTLSTKTVDLTGNINSTWINQTATVSPCPETYSWCGRQDVFFWNQSSNLTGFRKLNNVPEKDAQRNITSSSITSSSGEVTLGTWITDTGAPGTTTLAPGSWDFRTYFTASSSAGNTRANYRIFNQTPNGTKTWLFFGSAITKDITSGTIPGEYQTSYARRNYTTFYSGDRLGIQINVSTDSASARTVTMDMAGNTNASMVSISYFLCPSTAAPTTTPAAIATWQPEINPSTDIKTDYMELIKTWWWLPVLMLVMIMIFGRK
jgi:hypothetical protein